MKFPFTYARRDRPMTAWLHRCLGVLLCLTFAATNPARGQTPTEPIPTEQVPAVAPPTYQPIRLSSILIEATDQNGVTTERLDIKQLDRVLSQLRRHAASYPPRFNHPQDLDLARSDAKNLSRFFDSALHPGSDDVGMMFRAAMLNAMGHHLDVPGCAAKADALFEQVVRLRPNAVDVHEQYGLFLASSTRSGKAIVHLTKAQELGASVSVALGMAYFTLGDRKKAIAELQPYVQREPKDKRAAKVLAAIQSNQAVISKR